MNLFQRSLDDAPDIMTFRDSKPTLLVSWWCTIYALTIIVVRLCGRYVRAEKIFTEDGIMIFAITPILIRMSLVHVVLLYGTNNTQTDGLSDRDILRRQTGSQLVLASRIFYAASYVQLLAFPRPQDLEAHVGLFPILRFQILRR